MNGRVVSAVAGGVEFTVWCLRDFAYVAAASLQEAVYWFNAQSENAERQTTAEDAVACALPGFVNIADADAGERPVFRSYRELVAEHVRFGGTLPFYIAFTEP